MAFDFHGVITKHPEYFKELMKGYINKNFNFEDLFTPHNEKPKNEIWIISGPPVDELLEELKEYDIIAGIHYTNLDSITSFLLNTTNEHGCKIWKDKSGWWVDDKVVWDSAKAKICKKFNIDFLIDDTINYKKYFDNIKTEFIYFGG